ncbi:hypothetical protein AVEN_223383-1 [Araneus ventricosus]|uniref:Uncharacterized protein n=1 Tax=Araneus ventricosus TaxID=182803 RepID=A0A4Y2NNT9_ARAVE|nr:hypothetical protein AVEN_223383-1 [Araneus ventricosus]
MSRTGSMEVFLISFLAVAFLYFPEASSICDPLKFKCSNGKCVFKTYVCDGKTDHCGDNSDEKVCGKFFRTAKYLTKFFIFDY